MEDTKLEEIMKKSAEKVRPRRSFALKMRYRLWTKGIVRYFTGPQAKVHFAGATLVIMLVMSGGVGTYAYASADVNVSHPLFPVKEGIETIEGGFAFTPEQKAHFFMKKAFRRADEAELMHKKLREKLELNGDAEAIEDTLRRIHEEMEATFEAAGGEFDPEKAEEFINDMESKFGKLELKLGKLQELENGRPHIMKIRVKLKELKSGTSAKLERIKSLRDTVREARQGKQNRIRLNFLQIPSPPPPAPPT